VAGFKDVPTQDINALMEAVAQQPVSIGIEADQTTFQRGCIADGKGREELLRIRLIKGLGARPLPILTFLDTATIGDVKAKIERIDGTPAREQRLLVGGQDLGLSGESVAYPAQFVDHRPLADALKWAPKQYQDDLQQLRGDGFVEVLLVRVPPEWVDTVEDLSTGRRAFKDLDAALRSDVELAMAAVRCHGCALEYVEENLKSDERVVKTALQQDGLALRFAADELRNSREIVLTAVRSCGLALQYASTEFQNDREVVITAVRHAWRAFEFASPALRHSILRRKTCGGILK